VTDRTLSQPFRASHGGTKPKRAFSEEQTLFAMCMKKLGGRIGEFDIFLKVPLADPYDLKQAMQEISA
jgi:hypothetical protein